MSFSANGMPWSGPRERPAAISLSACRAWRRARSKVRVMKAWVWPSCCSTRRISPSTRSTGERSRDAIRRASSAIERSWKSSVTGVKTWARSESQLGLAVDVHEHGFGHVVHADSSHERELGGKCLPRQRILLRPLEPHRDGVAAEFLDVLLGEPDDLAPGRLVLVPGRNVLLLDVGVLVPR